jgi:hypothetical protein
MVTPVINHNKRGPSQGSQQTEHVFSMERSKFGNAIRHWKKIPGRKSLP